MPSWLRFFSRKSGSGDGEPAKRSGPPICGCCGRVLERMFTDFAYRRPLPYLMVPEAERASRVRESDDACIIDGKIFLVRGVLYVPIIDRPGWGLWASISKRNFDRYSELYHRDARDEPPFPGLLAASPPNYPDMLDAEVLVRLRTSTERPIFEATSFDNPLFREQRDGISTARWHQIVAEIEAYQSSKRH